MPSTGKPTKPFKMSTAIMAHPSRLAMRQDLELRLQDGIDKLTPKPVVVEDEKNSCWATAQVCWRLSKVLRADYHLVIQDDALPCRGFLGAARRAILALPAPAVVAFYWQPDRDRDVELADIDGHWITFNSCPSGVCVAMPTAWVEEFLQWCHDHFHKQCDADDTRLSAWLISTRRRCWVTMPSLVDHRGDESIQKHSYPFPRRAVRFIGEDFTDSYIDWRDGTADPPYREPQHPVAFLQFCQRP